MPEFIIRFFKLYTSQAIFFLVFAAAAVPILVYYRRKNPNPRFRPSAGEMSLVSLLAMGVCGVFAVGLGSLFNKDQDLRKLEQPPTVDTFSPSGDDGDSHRNSRDPKKRDSGPDAFTQYLLHQASGGK